jgi:hypothetical protein
MDLFIGIHKPGRTVGIRATCGIYRKCRCVQHRQPAASRRRKNKEGAWDALSVVQIAAWHGELTFALMTSEWIAPMPILTH